MAIILSQKVGGWNGLHLDFRKIRGNVELLSQIIYIFAKKYAAAVLLVEHEQNTMICADSDQAASSADC